MGKGKPEPIDDKQYVRIQFTTEQIIEALENNTGIIVHAAKALGIGRNTLSAWVKAEPELNAARVGASGHMLDLAKKNVLKALEAGDLATSREILRTLGKNEGFSERVETTGANGGAIQVDNRTKEEKIAAVKEVL